MAELSIAEPPITKERIPLTIPKMGVELTPLQQDLEFRLFTHAVAGAYGTKIEGPGDHGRRITTLYKNTVDGRPLLYTQTTSATRGGSIHEQTTIAEVDVPNPKHFSFIFIEDPTATKRLGRNRLQTPSLANSETGKHTKKRYGIEHSSMSDQELTKFLNDVHDSVPDTARTQVEFDKVLARQGGNKEYTNTQVRRTLGKASELGLPFRRYPK